MTAILIPDSPYFLPKQGGPIPGFSELSVQLTPAELLEDQRIQGAAIFQQMEEQDVVAAQMLPQDLATFPGTSFEVKRGGAIRPETAPAGVPLMLLLGGLGLLFLMR